MENTNIEQSKEYQDYVQSRFAYYYIEEGFGEMGAWDKAYQDAEKKFKL